MANERTKRGELQATFVDGSRQAYQVHETGQDIVFEWPGEGGVPNQHIVREENASSLPGWARELWEMTDVAVRTYDYIPAPR